jgi:hypothetical protein
VWCECLRAGVRRAVLLPRLDTIFAPVAEDPARERPYAELDWRLVSPLESDWQHYLGIVEKQAQRTGVGCHAQRVENMAQWVDGRRVVVPQYHLWLYRDERTREPLARLYEETDVEKRRALWRWLLAWTPPAAARTPTS